ncbi:Transposase, Ptta/En/Spm, plant [Quillaja saponaria]|uniref:Transposase, Ptta/En/Spm, plant n=1 Tax=Quillaja saponaria TaxID=32244 RepID=A0AAD7L2G6_QUISA|nr:Transposase, Ptta/En/Spm, plant [Quillaja saponaria]
MPPKRKCVHQDTLGTQQKQRSHKSQNFRQDTQPSHDDDHIPPPSHNNCASPPSLCPSSTQLQDKQGSKNNQKGDTSLQRPRTNDKPLLVNLIDATRNGAITSRKLCAREVWNIPQHLKVIVPFNLKGQGIKGGGRLFTRFLGLLACNSRYAPIHVTDWEWIPQENKVEIWRIIEEKFSFDYAKGKLWSMMSLGKLWRDYKHRLKCKYFKKHDTKDELLANGPPGLSSVEWWSFVDRHFDEKGKKLSKQDVENRNKLEVPHTAGSKCDAKKANEMLCPDTTSVLTPSRLHCHRSDAATTSATISDTSLPFQLGNLFLQGLVVIKLVTRRFTEFNKIRKLMKILFFSGLDFGL